MTFWTSWKLPRTTSHADERDFPRLRRPPQVRTRDQDTQIDREPALTDSVVRHRKRDVGDNVLSIDESMLHNLHFDLNAFSQRW